MSVIKQITQPCSSCDGRDPHCQSCNGNGSVRVDSKDAQGTHHDRQPRSRRRDKRAKAEDASCDTCCEDREPKPVRKTYTHRLKAIRESDPGYAKKWPRGVAAPYPAESQVYSTMISGDVPICRRWLYGSGSECGFACFISDLGPRPDSNHRLVRHDEDGEFDPVNCDWRVPMRIVIACPGCRRECEAARCGRNRNGEQRLRCISCGRYCTDSGLSAKQLQCPKCNAATEIRRYGFTSSGQQRYKCDQCEITFTLALRGSHSTEPLFGATANILRAAELDDDADLNLAIKLAEGFSELNAAEFLGPCYEAIVEARVAAGADERGLRAMALRHVKDMWQSTMSHDNSLDDMKEAYDFEPRVQQCDPSDWLIATSRSFVRWRPRRRERVRVSRPAIQSGAEFGDWTVLRSAKPNSLGRAFRQRAICRCRCGREAIVLQSRLLRGESTKCMTCKQRETQEMADTLHLPDEVVVDGSVLDWSDFNDWLAKKLGLAEGYVNHLRRVGVSVLNETTKMRGDRRIVHLERRLRQTRRNLRAGQLPPSLDYPVDTERLWITSESGEQVPTLIPLEKYSSGTSGKYKRRYGGQHKKRYRPRRLARA